MKIPNRERAIIATEKLVEYILNVEHKRGGAKARLLVQFGYNAIEAGRLEQDIRRDHLDVDVDVVRRTEYGTRYEISAVLNTPVGRSLKVRSIWQIDDGTDVPRLITLIPD